MKKFVFVLSLFLIVSSVFPQQYVLKVNLNNGTTDTIKVADVTKIYFELEPNEVEKIKTPKTTSSFMLLENYPNPFNPSTKIQYDIPKAGKVEINIYDISGKLIRTLKIQSSAAGLQRAEWDGKNEAGQKVVSGYYVYTVKFDQTVLSKKMILLK